LLTLFLEKFVCSKNYLTKYKFNNAEQDDLWNALDNQAKIDKTLDETLSVKQIMDTWTKKKGYPVVQLTKFRNNVSLTQDWFLLNPTLDTLKDDYKWYIPFTYTTKLQSQFEFESDVTWLTPEKTYGK